MTRLSSTDELPCPAERRDELIGPVPVVGRVHDDLDSPRLPVEVDSLHTDA